MHPTRLFAAAFVASLWSGPGCSSPAPEHRTDTAPTPGPRLSVLSYNVNFGIPGEPSTLAIIRQAGADIVLLQETTPAWERALRHELADIYQHMDFRHCCGAGGQAVLSRHPFTHQEYISAPSGWFPAWRLFAHTPLGDIQLLGVHLHPPVTESGSWVLGQFTTNGVRLREMATYAHQLAPDMPTIVAGDFNEGATGLAMEHMAERGYRDALAEFQPDAPTWRWRTSIGPLRAQLDHVLYNDRLRAIDARVMDGGHSDHLAVLAVFTWPDE